MIGKTTDHCNVTHVIKGKDLKYESEPREESGIFRDIYSPLVRCLLSSKRNHFLLQCIGVLACKTVGRVALQFFSGTFSDPFKNYTF
jgi:hypothetical protein